MRSVLATCATIAPTTPTVDDPGFASANWLNQPPRESLRPRPCGCAAACELRMLARVARPPRSATRARGYLCESAAKDKRKIVRIDSTGLFLPDDRPKCEPSSAPSDPKSAIRRSSPPSREANGGRPTLSDGPPISARIDKPSSVPFGDCRTAATISLGRRLPVGSSARPVPKPADSGHLALLPSGNCLHLHEVGFAVPRRSPDGRCALTAPFHPYRRPRPKPGRRRSVLCGTVPDPAEGRWALPTTLSYRARTFLPTGNPDERPPRCVGVSVSGFRWRGFECGRSSDPPDRLGFPNRL